MKSINVFLRFSLLIFSAYFLNSCNLDDPDAPNVVIGAGPLVDEVVSVDTIQSVTQFGYGLFYVKRGTEQKVTIRAQQNILDHITYGVTKNDFSWGFDGNISIDPSSDSIIVTCVITKDIKSINLAGTGAIIADGPRQKNISLQLNGSGSILNYGLPINVCKVSLPGTGVMQISVSDSLSGLVSGQGYVYYKGYPYIALPVVGSGDVVSDN